MKATYSPDDNKLRLYADGRLAPEDFAVVKAAGFRWAPKQELFVAPMWTPCREDVLLRFCEEIEDEDSSLIERSEDRAARFDEYSGKRADDAQSAAAGVQEIAGNIPMGQPILVGHHSERKARRDAEKIERGMQRAVKMWETSEYWTCRAAGAIADAKNKERPEVRARRIKKIEASKRKLEKETAQADKEAKLWGNLFDDETWKKNEDGERPTLQRRALAIANFSIGYGAWSDLDRGKVTPKEAQERALKSHKSGNAHRARWLTHYENRLTYEKAMLDSQGGSDLLKPKPRPKQLPLCNYRAPDGIEVENLYQRGVSETYHQIEMTKDEYTAIWKDRKWTVTVGRSHRVRCTRDPDPGSFSRCVVFLTDSKAHKIPAKVEKATVYPPDRPAPVYVPKEDAQPENIKAMQESLKAGGVKTVSAPQLFPTPRPLAARMVKLAEIEPGDRVLEPSAGTGNLIGAMGCRMYGHNPERGELVAVEISQALADGLEVEFPKQKTIRADFLACSDLGTFDRIIMNPPFIKGADIKHIQHAVTMLRPSGVLVALCANGPRQNDKLKPLADEWEDLPAGSFSEVGTGVNVALLTIRKPTGSAGQMGLF